MVVIANAGSDEKLAYTDLPDDVALSGGASGGTAPYVQWQWYILDKPDGSSAAFDDSTLQDPTLEDVDTWGNYLLFLTVQDTASDWSEQDPLLAPTSAMVTIRVEGQNTDIQKPAAGERDYSRVLHEWAAAVEQNASGLASQVIADHDTTATGLQLNTLVGGGNADALHTHSAAGLSVATTTAAGVVKLATTPSSPSDPKVVTRNMFAFTAKVDGTMGSSGWQPGVIDVAGSGNFSRACLAFIMGQDTALQSLGITMLDAGEKAKQYVFKLYELTQSQFEADNFGSATELKEMTFPTHPTTDNGPAALEETVAQTVSEGNVVALVVHSTTATVKGGGMSVYIDGRVQY